MLRDEAGRTVWIPHEGPQTAFLSSTVNEALYGGSMGGGKSVGLGLGPTRHLGLRGYKALLLRRQLRDLTGLLEITDKVYRGIEPRVQFRANRPGYPPHYEFPFGSYVMLSHVKDEDDKFNYNGHEYQFIGWDELSHFTFGQYQEVNMRLRGDVPGLPPWARYIRATANPGGRHASWVFKRWQPWLDPKFEHPSLPKRFSAGGKRLPPARSGQVLWFICDDKGRDELVPAGTPNALSRTFIRARLKDNPTLMASDPRYGAQLSSLDPVRRAQARDGDWTAQARRGVLFPSEKWNIQTAPPSRVVAWVRFWDLACTPERGDYAVGVLMGLCEDRELWIADVARMQGTPGEIRALLRRVAKGDGPEVPIRIEQEPGSAGKFAISDFVRLLMGFDVEGRPATGEKLVRAFPLAAQLHEGNIYLRRAPWNRDYTDEHEDFPEKLPGRHDDQVDASSGALQELAPLIEDEDALRDLMDSANVQRALNRRGKGSIL